MTMNPTPTNQPAAELRDGGLKVAIFANPTKEGDGVRYSGRLSRSYVDKDGVWQETSSLSGSEWLRAANLLTRAYNEELALKTADKQRANQAVTA